MESAPDFLSAAISTAEHSAALIGRGLYGGGTADTWRVPKVFIVVAVAACGMPVWCAARVDPVQALRNE
jgi:hypothetical protein